MKKRFPTFGVLLLALAIIWLLTDLKVIVIDIPLIPIILIIISIGWIINHYSN
jgi:hypothetical protein